MQYYTKLPSLYLNGAFQSLSITVETYLQRGIPRFQISGLNGAHNKDTCNRIRCALNATQIKIPYMSLIVNLAPVDIRKSGAYLDLSIATSIIQALLNGMTMEKYPSLLQNENNRTLFLGELSLSGEICAIPQLPALLLAAQKNNFQRVVVPDSQYNFSQIFSNLHLIPMKHLRGLWEEKHHPPFIKNHTTPRIQGIRQKSNLNYLQFNPRVERALALCAAGWHSILFIGPPGSGKTSLAHEILALLPPPNLKESLEILANSGKDISFDALEKTSNATNTLEITRPLRAPHHTSSTRALIGGGRPIQAGEASRAHHGVLILDELGEFSRASLQALREPLQEHKINLSKGEYFQALPANFLLCATTNPCPCGDLSKRYISCGCSDLKLKNYTSKFMGALRDRIDIEVWVDRKDSATPKNCKTMDLHAQIAQAHEIQKTRFSNSHYRYNSDIDMKEMENYLELRDSKTREQWQEIMHKKNISYRSLAGIRRLARTAADLDGSMEIRVQDILEAASYRCLDTLW